MNHFSRIGFNLIICAGILVGLLGFPFSASAQTELPPALFSDPSNPPAIAQSLDPVIMRERYVEVNIEILAQAREAIQSFSGESPSFAIQIQLFPDADFVASLSRVEDMVMGGYVLRGSVQGESGSEVHLAVQDNVLSGSVMLPGADYNIEYKENRLHLIQQVNPALGPPTRDPLLPPDLSDRVSAAADYGLDDDGSQIDLMVVYTTQARSKVLGGTAGINTKIAAEIDIINTGYANSGINHRMRLVHTAEVDYTQSSGDGEDPVYDYWVKMLNDLTGKSDGKMDQVHILRDQYHADLVMLVTEQTGFCGIAWVLQNENLIYEYIGFSLVSYACMGAGSYTMAHETGHNLGAAHDRNTGGVEGIYPWARGYQSAGNFYTIMAYTNYTHRINHWSNPEVTYNGVPTGVDYQAPDSADNVRALNQSALLVAQFRDAPPPAAPSNLAARPISKTRIDLSWSDNSNEETRYHVERTLAAATSWQEIATIPANTVSFADTHGVCGTAYRYRVRAHGPGGYSAYTAEITTSTKACLDPPLNLTALAVSKSQIRLDWEDVSSNEDGFIVERRAAGQTTWSEAGATGQNVETFLDGGLACETTYQYRVYGFNEDGPSEYTGIASATTALCPPSDLSGSALSQSRIALMWVDNSGSEDGYLLERSRSGLSDWQPLGNLPANSAAFEDSALACGTAYDYRLGAFKFSALDSEKAQITVSTAPCAPPPAPQGLSATALSGTLVRLTWQDVLDDEESYQIDRREKGQTTWTPVGAAAQNYTEFIDRHLDWGQEYEYRVLAVNDYGATPGTLVSVKTYSYGLFIPLSK